MATISDQSLPGVGAHRASAYTAMQEDYLSGVEDYLDDPVESQAPKTFARNGGRKLKGQKSIKLARTSRPGSASAAGEGYRHVTPRTTSHVRPEIISRKVLAALGSTLEVREDARAGQASWVTATDEDMAGLEDTLLFNMIHNIYFGHNDVLGRIRLHSVVGGVSVLTLYPRSNRGSTGSTFWDTGLLGSQYGIGEGRSVAVVPAANGFGGSPFNAATTAVGDPGNTTSFLTTGERYVTAINNDDPENPTVTLDADISAAGTIVGGFLIGYGSRRYSVNADPTQAISEKHSMFGVADAFTSSNIVPAHLGLLKTSVAGMRPQYFENGGVAGRRQWIDRMAARGMRRCMELCGRAPTSIVVTMAQMEQVTEQYANLRRFEPVQGKQGADFTTMSIVAHGRVLKYIPDMYAIPSAAVQTDPMFSQYLQTRPLGPAVTGYERRFVPGTDQETLVLARRGNILFSVPMGLAMTDDLVEYEYEEP